MSVNKRTVAVYVDGFNFYHALQNLRQPHLKWVNLRALAEKFIDRAAEEITKVSYFSAVATHMDADTVSRHRAYISALRAFDVDFIEGNFKKRPLVYSNKHISLTWQKHEEKETDVNIAIHIVRDAIKKKFDKILLISNDTDITPALKMAKKENPQLKIKVLTPPTYTLHYTLKDVTGQRKPINILANHIEHSLMPEMVKLPNGKIITIPESYKKP